MATVTPQLWAQDLLRSLGDPLSAANEQAVVSWEAAEGGNWHNTAHYNPLNTTQREPGSTPMNPVGVQSYTSWQQGLDATTQTLRNGNYGGVLTALARGDNAAAVENAVTSSPWGTKSITNISPGSYTPSATSGGGVLSTVGHYLNPGTYVSAATNAIGSAFGAAIGDATKVFVSWAARLTVTSLGLAMVGVGVDRALTGGKGATSVKAELTGAAEKGALA